MKGSVFLVIILNVVQNFVYTTIGTGVRDKDISLTSVRKNRMGE